MIRTWWRIALARTRMVQAIVPAPSSHAHGFGNRQPFCVYWLMNQLVHLQ